MAGRVISLPGGGTAIVCGPRSRRRAPCSYPGCSAEHTRLCDFAVRRGLQRATCDKKLCDLHAAHVGANRDYCLCHPRNLELEF